MALSQNTKKLIIRIVLFLVYLLVGAAIFQAIELHYEKKQRSEFKFQEFLKNNFTDKYNISDDDMKDFLQKLKKAIELGFDLQTGEYPSRFQWHFMNAFFFAGNVVTTIGYGHLVPTSFWGRFFCIFYALVGIPLTGLTLRSVGNRISEGISTIIKGFERKVYNRETEKLEIKTAVIAFILLSAIIIFPAFGFKALEGWTYFDSVYFCFVTLTTIGFGDFVPVYVKKKYPEDDATPVVLEFLNLIYMVVGLAVMSGVIVSISGVIEEKTKLIAMPDPFETLRIGNLNSKALRKLGMGPNGSDAVRPQRVPPKLNSSIVRGLDTGSNLDRSQSADNMDFQGPTPILHLNKSNMPCEGTTENTEGSPQNSKKPKLMFQNKVVPVNSDGVLHEPTDRKFSTLSSFENRSDSHDEIERELAPNNGGNSRRNTLTEKTGSKNELVVRVQVTPVPTPRSSPVPISPGQTEQEERSNPREEPTLEVEEHKIIFTNKHKPTNGEHLPSVNHTLSAEKFDKGSVILNGCVGQPKEQKDNRVVVETIALNETSHQPINR